MENNKRLDAVDCINFLSEMEYTDIECAHETHKVLAKGTYKGHDVIAVSLGSHPCCYIRINEDEKCYGKDYNDIMIDCHGGLTFSDSIEKEHPFFTKGYWVGWDFAHLGDAFSTLFNGKHWTTYELIEELREAVDSLIELQER